MGIARPKPLEPQGLCPSTRSSVPQTESPQWWPNTSSTSWPRPHGRQPWLWKFYGIPWENGHWIPNEILGCTMYWIHNGGMYKCVFFKSWKPWGSHGPLMIDSRHLQDSTIESPSIVLEWLHQGCDGDLSAGFCPFMALMIFLPNFLLKKVLQNRVFCRFGAGIRSWGVKSILRKIFWEEKLLCVKASV